MRRWRPDLPRHERGPQERRCAGGWGALVLPCEAERVCRPAMRGWAGWRVGGPGLAWRLPKRGVRERCSTFERPC